MVMASVIDIKTNRYKLRLPQQGDKARRVRAESRTSVDGVTALANRILKLQDMTRITACEIAQAALIDSQVQAGTRVA